MISWPLIQAGVIGAAGIGGTIALAAKTAYQRRPVETPDVYGSARFMNKAEIVQSGLLVSKQDRASDGVYIGAWRDPRGTTHYLRDVSNGHVLICGPTRCGKGLSCILPTILTYRGALIVNDEKGELYSLAGPWRAANIGPTIKWEPGAISGSASWNPLTEVRLHTPHEIADVQNVALQMIDIRGHGLDRLDHWQKAAVPLLAGMILHELYESRGSGRIASLGDVAARFGDPTSSDSGLFEEMRDNSHVGGDPFSSTIAGPGLPAPHFVIAAEGAAQLKRSDRERSGVSSTLRTFFTLFSDPIVSANTNQSDFRLDELADGPAPVSIFITTLPNDTIRLRPLVRLFITIALRSLMTPRLILTANGQTINPHRYETLVIGDEFPSLGKLEEIETALPRCLSWGIKFLLCIQDLTQLNGIYGLGHSIIANMHTRVYFPTNDLATAKLLSESTGTMTASTRHSTISGRRAGFLSNVTKSIQPTARPLLTPGEILSMAAATKDAAGRIIEPGRILVFLMGQHPLAANQMLYFLDPLLQARVP